jgi:signal transduction histidine kinase
MAAQNELNLGRPIPVISIDEVGDLTAALGRLRTHLELELEGYRTSLRNAKEADRVQNKFFADVSHELRTPLTSITGYAQLLLEGAGGKLTDTQREDIAIILGSGKHLLQLIKDIIDLSIIESGQLRLSREEVDLAELCRAVMKDQSSIAWLKAQDSSDVTLEVQAPGTLPPVVGDPVRLRQVVNNLVSNAIKFTSQGSVTVCLEVSEPGWVQLDVRDTGAGISAAELPHIFERLRQTGTSSMQRQGTGLGLGITRHLVLLHDGDIQVQSEVGKGSTFTVWLPVADPPRAAGPGEAAS